MTAPRLAPGRYGALPPPAYEPQRHGAGIVHLGIGAFHRAHMAAYTDAALAAAGGDWRILGVSLRSPTVRDQLEPQGGLYTLVERSGAGDDPRVIGAVSGVIVAPEAPLAVLAALAAPATRIVSLTVTEKGYCHDPATGRLDLTHPDIAHDIANPSWPRSAPGFLVAMLAMWRATGTPPPVILSCDNLPGNGALLHGLLIDLAARSDPGLARWIERQVRCPATMVDRIVPATTPADIVALEASHGVHDAGLVKAEPFTQWVVEDFDSPRPAWPGVEFVADVRANEHAKLRLLNGAHSAIAYLGLRAGHGYVHHVMGDPALGPFIAALMEHEIAPTLDAPAGLDLARYAARLLERFRNPALMHRTAQIAMDGSQKLPQRWLGTLADRLRAGQAFPGLALCLAAWLLHVAGAPQDDGTAPPVSDPMADRLAKRAENWGGDPARLAAAVLSFTPVFPPAVGQHPAVVAEVTAALRRLLSGPTKAAAAATAPGRA